MPKYTLVVTSEEGEVLDSFEMFGNEKDYPPLSNLFDSLPKKREDGQEVAQLDAKALNRLLDVVDQICVDEVRKHPEMGVIDLSHSPTPLYEKTKVIVAGGYVATESGVLFQWLSASPYFEIGWENGKTVFSSNLDLTLSR